MRNDSADSSDVIEIALEETFLMRPINTKVFEPFVIARLMEHSARVENTLDYEVMLQDVGEAGMRTIPVRWLWAENVIPVTPLAAQPEDITEWAACVLACAVISKFTDAALVMVAQRGERFDYVLSENGVQCGLEISGTQTEDRQTIRDRQQQKMRQLLANPKRWGDYVIIVGFARREIWVSRHSQEEKMP